MNYLKKLFPEMNLPFISLGNFPTPISKLEKLSSSTGGNLFVKHDDISGSLYGGNKVRKLEYLLADAIGKGAKRVITTGAVGSNHALAVARYCKHIGLKSVLMLFGDQQGEHVRNNLLADFEADAEMHYNATYEEQQLSFKSVVNHYRGKDGLDPYFIPAGGTSLIGIAGYLNAAFELKDQIDNKKISVPSAIFLPLGTMGTAAGLILGLKILGLKCKVIPVLVVPSFLADEKKLYSLICSADKFFHGLDNSFPLISIKLEELQISKEYLGNGYGIITEKAEFAINKFYEQENIILDGVYSGKAAAAFLDYCTNSNERGETVLFWNTKSSVMLTIDIQQRAGLPEEFQKFF